MCYPGVVGFRTETNPLSVDQTSEVFLDTFQEAFKTDVLFRNIDHQLLFAFVEKLLDFEDYWISQNSRFLEAAKEETGDNNDFAI